MDARRLRFFQSAGVFVHTIVAGALAVVEPLVSKEPYHTSILTGEAWVQELLHGHPKRIHTELGVHLHVFQQLVMVLQECGMQASKWISLEEKVAIFLYASVTGLSIRHLGERFQHSNETISR
jgi:hypothetical protein